MARKDRTGNRKTREQRAVRRIPEMGYYLVVTDTEATERCFFNGLHDSLPEDVKKKLVIKVVETKTQNMIEKCLEMTAYEAQYRIPWIVFDRDRVVRFDEIIKQARREGVHVGWSNPCIEIWFDAYFGKMHSYQDSVTCCREFGATFEKKTGQEYQKANRQIYDLLNRYGDESEAIRIAENRFQQYRRDGFCKPSEMCPCTTVQHLVDEIKKKTLG